MYGLLIVIYCFYDLTNFYITNYNQLVEHALITEMASYIKSIDKEHLLEVGLEGFHGESAQDQQFNQNIKHGTNFIMNNQFPEIDFTTMYSYPDQW